MSIKAGRVGVNPSQVDPVDGSILSSATSGYTKQEADAKFETQANAASTYETKSEALTALGLKQNINLQLPIELLSGSALTVETALHGINVEKFTYADNGLLGAKNLIPKSKLRDRNYHGAAFAVNSDGSVSRSNTCDTAGYADISNSISLPIGEYVFYVGGDVESVAIEKTVGTATSVITSDDNELVFTIENDSDTVILQVGMKAQTYSDVIYPMILVASDPDRTFRSYAMTNQELTEVINNKVVNALTAVSGGSIDTGSQACVTIGKLFVGMYVLTASDTVSEVSGFPTFVSGAAAPTALIRDLTNGTVHTANNFIVSGKHTMSGLTSGVKYSVIVVGICA